MRHSIEPREGIYLKGYGFLPFANTVKKFLIVLKKSTTDAVKTVSKRAIQKTAQDLMVI